MAKGKKFDAAEKHFREKEIMYSKMINQREDEIKELKDKLVELNSICKNLEKENEILNKENSKLLEYTGLDKKDIKIACKKDVELTKMMRGMNVFGNYLHRRGDLL
jgi:predicted RNase H-like nuclease (RuvC/YqgF family)